MTKTWKRYMLRMLCEGAVMVAVAQVLGYIKIWEMPWGGSICLSMLPIFLFSCRWGLVPGLMSGFVLGVLQFMFDGGFALGWQSIIGDYLVAFTVLGLAGLFRYADWSIYAGITRIRSNAASVKPAAALCGSFAASMRRGFLQYVSIPAKPLLCLPSK